MRKKILVLHVLVMFHTSESIELSKEVLSLWGHEEFYRALVVRRYLKSTHTHFRIITLLENISGIFFNNITPLSYVPVGMSNTPAYQYKN